LAQKTAVITGAARGIGLGIAERLLADGYRVALWDLDGQALEQAAASLGRRDLILTSVVDVADAAAVQHGREAMLAAFGRIDLLVNNAGWDRFDWFVETDPAFWQRVVAVNYVGVLNTCRWLGPDVVAQRGRIINIASDTAKLGYALEAVYSGAKGGVVAFSRALARELGQTGTTVNVICPGATDTPLLREAERYLTNDPRFSSWYEAGFVETVVRSIPLGRLGSPADVANAVSFLAGPEAAFITGQVLSVDGGQTMYYGM
jgi:2-hydroxycyclohexanecarboxyl-CoA dehydrogenase